MPLKKNIVTLSKLSTFKMVSSLYSLMPIGRTASGILFPSRHTAATLTAY